MRDTFTFMLGVEFQIFKSNNISNNIYFVAISSDEFTSFVGIMAKKAFTLR